VNRSGIPRKIHIGIFLSGKGSNAEAIIEHFIEHPYIRVKALYTNKEGSGARSLANKYHLPILVFDKQDIADPSGTLAGHLKKQHISTIVLAGFLWLIPSWLVQYYPRKIINIHPALLPGYGGKGMYGKSVHEAVFANKEKETGMTIHLVNEQYDEGDIIAQYKCPVSPSDTPEDIEKKVRALELRYYPEVIERYLSAFSPQDTLY